MSLNAWQKFLKGDESSFSELYSEYFKELFAYGTKLGFDKELCKDAIQDIFYTVYANRNRMAHINNIEFYLLHALKNRLLSLYGHETKIQTVDYHEVHLMQENHVVDEIIREEKHTHLKNKIKQLIEKLPRKQQKIIHYYYNLGLSYDEIAIALDMNVPSVKKSLYRTLKKLQTGSSTNRESNLFSFLLIL